MRKLAPWTAESLSPGPTAVSGAAEPEPRPTVLTTVLNVSLSHLACLQGDTHHTPGGLPASASVSLQGLCSSRPAVVVQLLSGVRLWPHELQHSRVSCPSPSPWASSNSCPSSQWCHPTISSSVSSVSSCTQSFPASGLFQWVDSLH